MDGKRLREVHERLAVLDERFGHRLRARHAGPARMSTEQVEDRLRLLTEMTLELAEQVRELVLAIGSRSTETESAASGPRE